MSKIDLESYDFSQNPYKYYNELLDANEIYYLETQSAYLVTSFNLALKILRNPKIFSSSCSSTFDAVLLGCDPPLHTAHRKVLSDAESLFSRNNIELAEEKVRSICRDLLSSLQDKDFFDIVEEVANRLPTLAIFEILGIDESNEVFIRNWTKEAVSNKMVHSFDNAIAHSKLLKSKIDELILLSNNEFYNGRKLKPSLIYNFTNEQIYSLIKVLLIGGNETTPNLISGCVFHLYNNKDIFDLVLKDSSNIDRFINEVLRYESPAQIIHRLTLEETTVGDKVIPPFSTILISIAACNRDRLHFESPEKFDIFRENSKNIAFGYGPHNCIGASLSMIIVRVFLEEFIPIFYKYKIPNFFKCKYYFSSQVRGLTCLPLVKRESSDNWLIYHLKQQAIDRIKFCSNGKYIEIPTYEYYPTYPQKKDKGWHYTYPSPFIHANVMYSLINSGNKELAALGIPFLKDFSINQMVWSFWIAEACQHPVPPDVDDTALASHLLSKFGYEINNKSLLLDNIDESGNIKTWIKNNYSLLLKQPSLFFSLKKKNKFIVETHRLGMFSWDDSELGVAANVLMYLGENRQTKKAIEKCIKDWRKNKKGQYYDKKIIVAYHIARAYYEGIVSFNDLKSEILEFIESDIDLFCFTELLYAYLITEYFNEKGFLNTNLEDRIKNELLINPDVIFEFYPYFTSKDKIFYAGSNIYTAALFLEASKHWK